MKTFATFVKENFMLKGTWYLTTRFLRACFNFVSSKRGVESFSHLMTHGLIIMPTKAMSTGRSFKDKTNSSI